MLRSIFFSFVGKHLFIVTKLRGRWALYPTDVEVTESPRVYLPYFTFLNMSNPSLRVYLPYFTFLNMSNNLACDELVNLSRTVAYEGSPRRGDRNRANPEQARKEQKGKAGGGS